MFISALILFVTGGGEETGVWGSLDMVLSTLRKIHSLWQRRPGHR